jgi:DNA-binding MarR family transcriptional regulator
VTGLVRRLQQLGLIDLAPSTVDGRAKMVVLTDAGRRLVESFAERHAERIEQVMSGLDAGERDELLRLLTQLGGHLERVAASDGDGERRRRQSEHPIAAEKRNSRCGC